MKTYVLKIALFLFVAGTFVACSKDKDPNAGPGENKTTQISYDNLPQAGRDFIETNFPKAIPVTVEKFSRANAVGTLYRTTLSSDYIINFDAEGKWTGISSKKGGVPAELILPAIKDYVQQNYPGATVREIELENRGFEVELSNNVELYFNLQGQFVFADTDDDKDETPVSFDELPKNARDFLNTNFANAEYIAITMEEDDRQIEYEVKLNNRFEIDFDSNGNWTSIDGNRQQIPDKLIPNAILDYVKAGYAGLNITEIERDDKGYEVGLSNDKDLIFDKDGKFLKVDD